MVCGGKLGRTLSMCCLYLLIAIAIGSVIYGFMPTDLLEQYAGPDNPFAIPVAAVISVPLYIRAEAVIPLAAALMAKGGCRDGACVDHRQCRSQPD